MRHVCALTLLLLPVVAQAQQPAQPGPMVDVITAAYRQGLILGEVLGRQKAIEEMQQDKKKADEKESK